MTIYELDFNFFDGSDWKVVAMTIAAESLESLKAKFLEETYGILEYGNRTKTTIELQENLWTAIERDIAIIALPLVTNRRFLH